MTDLFLVVLRVHIVLAVAASVLMWPPLLTRKGGRVHRATGKIFYGLTVLAMTTALGLTAMELMRPHDSRPRGAGMPLDMMEGDEFLFQLYVWLLAYVALATLLATVIGVRLLRSERPRSPLAAIVLLAAGLAFVVLGAVHVQLPVLVVGAAGAAFAAFLAVAMRRIDPARELRVADHATSMLVAAVGLYSTISVVVVNRVATEFYRGPYGVIAWALPTLLAVPGFVMIRRGVAQAKGAAADA